ncbi:hypothetical protein OH76DRAFT_608389 [Lentinus brumalis]|uniref:DUF7702 domain-containing protein n=1 Tax=Lentinus brumalis TaxID=2498619 RepID=A0A371DUQ1_9APHY|nr:hypothetical protein OH76DRAFT_608389 [Polyporus brumalis]
MGLDARGIIAAVQIATYGPLLFVAVFLAWWERDRRMGWAFLGVLSVLRLMGGMTHVLSEYNPTNVAERTIYIIAEGAGQGPLLAATLGFLRTVSQHSLDKTFVFSRGIIVCALSGATGVILAIIGGARGTSATTWDEYDDNVTLRHVAIILFIILFSGMLCIVMYCWMNWKRILRYRRRLLIAITMTVPLLLVRIIYGVLSAWGPATVTFVGGHQVPVHPSDSGLGKFSAASSQWGIYFVMSVMMEYIAVAIYLLGGVLIPLRKETSYESEKSDGDYGSGYRDAINKKNGVVVEPA